METRSSKRLKHHLLITALTGTLLFIFYVAVPGNDKKYLWSMATAYASIVLLGITMILGPLNVITNRNNPISSDLRRDFGIWSAVVGLVHVIIGIQVHMGNAWLYFFKAVTGENAFKFRADLFGAANYAGLCAAVLLFLLLLLSNDLSMRILKTSRWKGFQRWSYFLFCLTIAHGILYQVIEKRILAFVITFIIILLIPLIFQLLGFLAYRQNR
jgi:methionine sulfoxide reductase heme-binding subunit